MTRLQLLESFKYGLRMPEPDLSWGFSFNNYILELRSRYNSAIREIEIAKYDGEDGRKFLVRLLEILRNTESRPALFDDDIVKKLSQHGLRELEKLKSKDSEMRDALVDMCMTALADANMNTRVQDTTYTMGEGCLSVTWCGETYHVGKNAALALELMHTARQNGEGWVSASAIFDAVYGDEKPKNLRLANIFSSRDAKRLWKAGFIERETRPSKARIRPVPAR